MIFLKLQKFSLVSCGQTPRALLLAVLVGGPMLTSRESFSPSDFILLTAFT